MTLPALTGLEPSATLIFNRFAAGIYTCDPVGNINYFNEAAASIWGRHPILGKDLWTGAVKIYSSDGALLPADKDPMAIAIQEGIISQGTEIIVERPDGSRINVIAHPQATFDTDGNLAGGMNMLWDITANRNVEKKLKKVELKYKELNDNLEREVKNRTEKLSASEDRYHKMIEEVQDYAIILLDREGTILNWNKGAEHIKGYKDSEIIGNNFRIFYRKEDRDAKLPESLISQAIEKGKAAHEGWRRKKDGTLFWGSVVITALHDADNNVIGFSKVTRDLTEKKLADDRLDAYSKDISLQNKQLQTFAYIASHDLQEPLRKIRIFSEMLAQNPGDKDSAALLLNKINTAAGRMSQLINDVLSYSKVGQAEVEFSEVDLEEILNSVKHDYELLLEEKNVRIFHQHLPLVKGIPVQLQQLFANLINNSIKFSEKDPLIEISAELLPAGTEFPGSLPRDIDHWKISFKDNGVGVDAEYRDRIFELFQRLDPSKKGTGIGLALCKKVVENHHGFITVTGEPGLGTTFDIYLPAMGNKKG